MKACVAIALSGGVDSTAAALLLKDDGYQVIGVTMRTWSRVVGKEGPSFSGCQQPQDEDDARRVAQALDIPFHVIDMTREYRAEVIDYLSQEYLAGRTPNPCVRCNQRVKFGALLDEVRNLGVEPDYLATGHYARVEYDATRCRYILKKAKDAAKDQSYFLSSLSQDQLARSLFPLGERTKTEARSLAASLGLGLENRRESQDFAADYSPVRAAAEPGPIVNGLGNLLGRHHGIPLYTIGQRRGLGVATGEPLYVTAIDRESNTITVGTREDVYRDELVASQLSWVAVDDLRGPLDVTAKIRYSHGGAGAVITPIGGGKVHARFTEPQMAIAPGQAVVFYDGEEVVGGGIIEASAGHPV
ncbi:MAG: tRNA 2-thiouridine(34) synthase MnmA [Chloroflexota bacterium]